MTYAGPNNPKNFLGKDDFTYVPDYSCDYQPIGHDRRYDRLGAVGAKGLLTDPRTIGADWVFVYEESVNSTLSGGMLTPEGIASALLAVGLGALSLPKTIVQMSKPYGMSEIVFWYHYSSIGVNNIPDKSCKDEE